MLGKIWVFSLICALLAIYLNSDKIQNFFYHYYHLKTTQETVLTADELKLYNGVDKPELYLAILGQVYDVSKGLDKYGPGKTYNFFVGKDAARSFVTGDFDNESASDEVADFNAEQCRSLNHWIKFYRTEYDYVGKVSGRYFDVDGKATPYRRKIKKMIKNAEKSQQNEDDLKTIYPPCNMEWDMDQGSHVWCTSQSGGIPRDWVGKPRKMFETGKKGHRCACVNQDSENLAIFERYDKCDDSEVHCYF